MAIGTITPLLAMAGGGVVFVLGASFAQCLICAPSSAGSIAGKEGFRPDAVQRVQTAAVGFTNGEWRVLLFHNSISVESSLKKAKD